MLGATHQVRPTSLIYFYNQDGQLTENHYDGIDEKGFLKVPYTDEILADDVTPKEALEILEQHILGIPKHE